MNDLGSKKHVYLLMGICLLIMAASLLLLLWIRNNPDEALRLGADRVVSDGPGYEISTSEAAKTYVIGDYTARVGQDGVTLMSAKGEERIHFETDLPTPLVLQEGSMLVVGSAASERLFVLDRNGNTYRVSLPGEAISVFARDDQMLALSLRSNGVTVLTKTTFQTDETVDLAVFERGQTPMRARFAPDGRSIDVLLIDLYGKNSGVTLQRYDFTGNMQRELAFAERDWFFDFLYLPDGSVWLAGAHSLVQTDAQLEAERRQIELKDIRGVWQAAGRALVLAGNDKDGFALYAAAGQLEKLVTFDQKPEIMPAVSDTYAILTTETSLQVIDVRGGRVIEQAPIEEMLYRVEFTGPTTFIVISERGIFPYAIQ